MFNQAQFIEQLTNQTKEMFKNNPFNDFETNFKAILHSMFEKFDLVSREEFDIQQRVLADTRAKLEALEKQVQEISKK
ncbi:MAG: accessory factor UbiK family protein [Neisseriaceae bacterium]|jgi:BMFP domain-containing protein YqiC|nr:MAG: accessory factor UbiK family protein [Neisseriaceae bacterium]